MPVTLTASVSDRLVLSDGAGFELLGGAAIRYQFYDKLANLQDAAAIAQGKTDTSEDRLTFDDTLNVRLVHFLTHTDTLAFSDALNLTLVHLVIHTDTLSLSDSMSAALAVHLTRSVSDALSLSDATSSVKSTTDTNYYRRYLGDVQ